MAAFYTYLIASLPYLQFGGRPPFSFEKFLKMCEGLIPDSELAVIASDGFGEAEAGAKQSPSKEIASSSRFAGLLAKTVLKKWQEFEIALRNELAKFRSGHRHIDPLKYQRPTDYIDFSLAHVAMSSHRNPSILEGEKILDRERWQFLEGLGFGHYFDLDFLIIYAIKLLILERWEKINTADKAKSLEGVLSKI